MNNSRKILIKEELDKVLFEKGFVVIPFLNSEEVTQLKDFYYAHHSSEQDGMYATAHVSDIPFRIKMNNFIKEKFERAIEETFNDCNPLGGSYIAKGKGSKGILTPHQDWNIVDEDKFRSFNIWVPMVDLTDCNGVICIVPESHTWQKTYRSANIPSIYQDREDEFWKTMQRLYMKAGEALIYDHRLIHASGQNETDEIRLAAVFGIMPKEAEMRYYHKKDEQTIDVFQSNKDFFLLGNIFDGPQRLKKIGEINLKENNSTKEVKELLTSDSKPSLLKRIWKFLNINYG